MATELHVNLTDEAEYDMHAMAVLTGHTATDVVNRAIQVYAYLERVKAAGAGVYVRNTVTGELREVLVH